MDFPQFPGEDFLAHAATLYLEQADARLAGRGLLALRMVALELTTFQDEGEETLLHLEVHTLEVCLTRVL